MKTLTSRKDKDFHFQRSWWDSDYAPAIILSFFAGSTWTLAAFTLSMIGDLDQSWYDDSPFYLLPLKVALFWPVWGTVQTEGIFTTLGWNIGNGVILVSILVAILPVVTLSAMWIWLSNRWRS